MTWLAGALIVVLVGAFYTWAASDGPVVLDRAYWLGLALVELLVLGSVVSIVLCSTTNLLG